MVKKGTYLPTKVDYPLCYAHFKIVTKTAELVLMKLINFINRMTWFSLSTEVLAVEDQEAGMVGQ